jgi:glutamate-5-semialdehyde dehydrogenase
MSESVQDYVNELGRKAKRAASALATASTEQKNTALRATAKALRETAPALLDANRKDVEGVEGSGKNEAFIDRLTLDEARIEGMASALEEIAALPDPVGRKLARFERPNGLVVERVSVPIGVIAMVYESRPNVGADAGALCLKSGNAIILRGGSESLNSTRQIVACLATGLKAAGLPEDCVQVVDTTDRDAVKFLLHCVDYVDLVIPRGGKGLVSLVQREAQVPTLLHLDGNVHTYVHSAADLTKAVAIIVNAKLRRTGVCGATESLVVDRAVAPRLLPPLLDALGACEVRGEAESIAIDSRILPASPEDWDTEYLDAILSVKLVDDAAEAMEFVEAHSSHHTDAIITEDADAAAAFLRTIDSAVVMHNASTQFSDGGEFGMGAEIGIATGKMHARGPVGLEQLTIYKYLVLGDGQTRP